MAAYLNLSVYNCSYPEHTNAIQCYLAAIFFCHKQARKKRRVSVTYM